MKLSCLYIAEDGILYREKLLKFKHVIGITHRENQPIKTNRFNFCVNSSRVGNKEDFENGLTHYLDVHYFEAYRKNKHKWKKKTFSFESKQLSLVKLYERKLRKGLGNFLEKSPGPKRPKKLLVFVNPVGGKGTAKRKYDKHVAPIFECAGIETRVVMTTHQNHAREHLLDNDVAKEYCGVVAVGGKGTAKRKYDKHVAPIFECAGIETRVLMTTHQNHAREHLLDNDVAQEYCGVVGVGGEGMASEIVNGLLGRQKLDVGMETLKKGFSYEKVGVRVGVIPCGSTNALAYTLQGF